MLLRVYGRRVRDEVAPQTIQPTPAQETQRVVLVPWHERQRQNCMWPSAFRLVVISPLPPQVRQVALPVPWQRTHFRLMTSGLLRRLTGLSISSIF